MNKSLKVAGLTAGLVSAAIYTASTARAADEWTTVGSWGDSCAANERQPSSSVGDAATGTFTICWSDDLNDVRVRAIIWDTKADGYHTEARIRYQVYGSNGWSGYHYRTAVSDYTADDTAASSGIDEANQPTRNLGVAVCLYNVDTLIDCDDRGWQ